MFCRNCGKPIPDDSKFCPHCGASCTFEQTPTTTPTQSGPVAVGTTISNVPINLSNNGGNTKSPQLIKLEKLGTENIHKLIRFSTIFKITSIFYFVAIAIYFAGAPIISAIDSHSSSGAVIFQKIYQWFLVAYSIGLIGISLWNIILLVKYKKLFELKINGAIIVKSIYMALVLGLIIALILKMTILKGSSGPEALIPSMVLVGLCFVTSGLSGTINQSYSGNTKSRLQKAFPELKL